MKHSNSPTRVSTWEAKSSSSSLSAASESSVSVDDLAISLQKSCDWLHVLNELHYFAYNSINSLTIYSHKFWPSQRTFLVSTKENNVKEVSFRACRAASKLEEILISHENRPDAASNLDGSGGGEGNSESSGSELYLEPVFKIHKLSKIARKLMIPVRFERFKKLNSCSIF